MRTHFRDNFSPSAAGRSASARTARQRGSALLIVLGFLSFMIISAVSFAIYMRIERQASSNYRHSVTARHLLNAGLFRAIDEIDSELRLQQSRVVKFPKEADWPGRVKVSAVSDDKLNNQDAHVLSIESLSYLPAFLINDVRRYAVRSTSDPSDEPYKGAKWRALERSTDGDIVGRYAYVCVNVSDMLDVNLCKAQARDSSTERVSLGHLFDNDAERIAFDNNVKNDLRYFSLQDFYAVRYDRNPAVDSSPYHDYLKNGRLTVFGNAANLKHVFSTESIVKPEPTNSAACNILLNPPFNATLMANRRPSPGQLVFDTVGGRKPFWEALKASPRNTTLGNSQEQMMAAMIKDYLDQDSVPSLLNMPCVEMAPMVSQIVFDPAQFNPKIVTRSGKAGDPAHDVTIYAVQLFGAAKAAGDNGPVNAPIYVELVWPFKYQAPRVNKPAFDVEVEAYLQLNKPHKKLFSNSFPTKAGCIPLTQMAGTKPNFWGKTITKKEDCYEAANIVLQADKNVVTIDIADSDGNFYNGFSAGQDFSVALIVFARVKSGSDYVDSAPQTLPYPGIINPNVAEEFNLTTGKLFFQTESKIAAATMTLGELPYQWSSLEVADPRFNYNASNWLKNNETPSTYLGENPSTKRLLEDGTGRDADIFMSVSDAGFMQSPGELGFIVRPGPYTMDSTSTAWDFSLAEPKDAPYMFRTFRLYDHGGTGNDQLRDNVYGHFYVMKADGTLPGARVNPLSDIPEVLEAAIWGTPLDYWIAATNNTLTASVRKDLTFNNSLIQFNKNTAKWEAFRDAWVDALDKVTPEVNKEWKNTLSDFYGEWTNFKWYSADLERKKIFEGFSLDNPMHEVDRKMLYSFSLDSFSDRQQLFLYILRAEATVPSFGGGADSGMRSLAGGRAVALVWRDPYPRGYRKTPETWAKKTGNNGWYPNNSDFESPWKQYGSTTKTRWDSYHDTRILFFKQLDK